MGCHNTSSVWIPFLEPALPARSHQQGWLLVDWGRASVSQAVTTFDELTRNVRPFGAPSLRLWQVLSAILSQEPVLPYHCSTSKWVNSGIETKNQSAIFTAAPQENEWMNQWAIFTTAQPENELMRQWVNYQVINSQTEPTCFALLAP